MSLNAPAPLWNMAWKKVKDVSKKNKKSYFRLDVCLLRPKKRHSGSKLKNLCLKVWLFNFTRNNKGDKKDSNHVLEIIMFYDNRKSPVFNLLSVVIYFIICKHVFIDYLCLQKEKNQCFKRALKKLCMTSFQVFALTKCCLTLSLVIFMYKRIPQK